jgi:HEAT repeat protein
VACVGDGKELRQLHEGNKSIMDYQELKKCIEIFQDKPKWFIQEDNLDEKLKCLDTFKEKATPKDISTLIGFIKGNHVSVQIKIADIIIYLFQQLKSQNELYDCLKYVDIEESDLNDYKTIFSSDTYLYLLAIASMNKNGYVREKAIKELALLHNSNAIKFIIFRLGDWVNVIREVAQKAIRTFFDASYLDVFLQQLPLIDWLLSVQRANLVGIHSEIIKFIFSYDFTIDLYEKLKKLDGKTKLTYVRYHLKAKSIDEETANLLSKDKNYLIRIELLKQIKKNDTLNQRVFIKQFLQDRSARVRVQALYLSEQFKPEFNTNILNLISDDSASVRDLAKYLLKDDSLNFIDIYRQRIALNERVIGSILGLSELGTNEDLPIYEKNIRNSSGVMTLVCLRAIHRIDTTISKRYALEFLSHSNRRVRYKCVEILSSCSGNEVLEKVRTIYLNGDYEQKKMSLKLFGQIGGWRVVGDLINSLTDSDENIQNLGWVYLKKWKNKARTLFTTPQSEDIRKANELYSKLDKSKVKFTFEREALWKELPFYLRG